MAKGKVEELCTIREHVTRESLRLHGTNALFK
jgi:hypothetical protein